MATDVKSDSVEMNVEETKENLEVTENAKKEATSNGSGEKAPEEKKTDVDMTSANDSPPTDLEKKIIKQVEYYFGDINFSRDRFLQDEVKKDDGWVKLDTLTNFKRLASLSTDHDVLRTALKKSASGLMEVDDEGDRIRRSTEKPLPENVFALRDTCKNRVIYAKGFPLDAGLDDIMEFLEQTGSTEHIQMRKDKDKKFKGSIFATFTQIEDAKKFSEADDLKYKEELLITMLKEEYFAMKIKERKQHKEEQIKTKQESKQNQEEQEQEDFKSRITTEALLEIKNLPADIKRETIKETFSEWEPVHWVDFSIGDTQAKVRFTSQGGANRAIENGESACGGKIKLQDTELEYRILEGEEELDHWRDLFQQLKERKFSNRRGGHTRGGGRGGRGGYRGGKRKGGYHDHGHSKRPKTDGN